ncbi:MAG: hypothetical protein R8L58_05035, partial [Mariprofundaceae bacterium]
MPRALRKIVLAGAGLSALALLTWYRIDAFDLQGYIAEQNSSLTDTTLEVRGSRISFLHGLGLRLDGVHVTTPSFKLESGHVDVGIHLLPLLLGKVEISGLAIHQGEFRLASAALP